MASLKKRNGYYSIVFITINSGKRLQKSFALGTRYKKIAQQKRVEYEKLFDSGEINPFEPGWNLKEYEERKKSGLVTTESLYLQDLLKQFLDDRTDVSEKTKTTYRYIINDFSNEVGKSLLATHIEEKDIR
ncbi:MAG: hypothetical protein WEC12_04305, partial [Balneolaceae bacterium]